MKRTTKVKGLNLCCLVHPEFKCDDCGTLYCDACHDDGIDMMLSGTKPCCSKPYNRAYNESAEDTFDLELNILI